MKVGHEIKRLAYGSVGANGDRIEDHAALAFFDAAYFVHLRCDVHIFVYDAKASQTRHHDSRSMLGYRIHRG